MVVVVKKKDIYAVVQTSLARNSNYPSARAQALQEPILDEILEDTTLFIALINCPIQGGNLLGGCNNSFGKEAILAILNYKYFPRMSFTFEHHSGRVI